MDTPDKNILIVEDEIFIAEAEAMELESCGYRVVIASSGEKAVDYMNSTGGIDLILMDIDLGRGMDGTEAANKILQNHDIPVIFLSSHTEPEIVGRTEAITSFGYVVKQSGITVLDASIKMAFRLYRANRDLREKERSLRESEESYRRLFETMAQGVVYQDAGGSITSANPAAERILGCPIEKMTGKTSTDLQWKTVREDGSELPGTDHPSMIALRTGVQSGPSIMGVYNPKDRAYRWISITGIPLFNHGEPGPYRVYTVFDDISERKLIEEELRESERWYMTIVDNATEGILIADAEKKCFMLANPSICRMLGYSQDELLGMGVGDIHPLDALPSVLEHFEQLCQGKMSNTEATPCLRKDGKIIFATITPARTEFNGRLCVAGFFSDVTERKRAEEEIRRSEALFRMIFENAPLMIDAFDSNGRCTLWNKSCEQTFGWSIDEVNSHAEPLALFYPDPDVRMKVMETVTSSPDREFREWHPRTKSGDERISMWANYLLPDGKVMNIGYDVTEQRRAEETLRNSELNYREIFNATNEAILIGDMATNQIIDMNETLVHMFGYASKEEVLAHAKGPGAMSAGVPPYTSSEILENISRAVREGPQIFEWQARKKNGDLFWVEISLRSSQIGGYGRILAVARDINTRKQAEEHIQQLLREKELLLKEVHHHVKNNMNMIQSILYLQSKTVDDPVTRNALKDAVSRVQSMATIYDKLYKTEHFREMNVRYFLPPLVDEIMSIFPVAARIERDIQIGDFLLSARLLPSVAILLNELITNSMKYAFGESVSGRLFLSVSKVDNTVSIEYSDNGPGMPQDISPENSTGFGLKLVGLLVKNMDGTLSIDRSHGTKYVIEFSV